MANKTDQTAAVRMVKALLIARRNNNVKQEQHAYEKLWQWTQKKGYDFTEVYEGTVRHLKKYHIDWSGEYAHA
jgi:hypothetical protein